MLLLFVMLVAICGLMYELILGTLSSYLLWDSVLQFSLTIWLFMTWMGIGAYSSRFFSKEPIKPFFFVEILLALLWWLSVLFLKSYYIASNFEAVTFYILFVIVTLFIWIFVGFEIPLVHEIMKKLKIKKEFAVSDIFTFDFLWALVASLSFPLIFLVNFWLYYTAIFTAFINLLVATAFVFEMKKHGENIMKLLIYPFVTLWVLVFAIYVKPYSDELFFERFYKEPVVFHERSMFADIVVTKRGEDTRLYIDWNLQFLSLDEERYHEALVDYPLALFPEKQMLRVLVLGGGDWLAIRNLLEDGRAYDITLVDLDSKITEIARDKHFLSEINKDSLKSDKLNIINDDAFTYMLKEEKNKYDFIIADFPDPRSSALSKLYSKEFYAMVHNSLKPQWIFVTQSSNAFFATKAMKSIDVTLEWIFWNSKPYHRFIPSFWDWGFVMARKWGEIKDEFCEAKFCEYFDYEYNELDVSENTLLEPKIIEYYIEWYKKFSL